MNYQNYFESLEEQKTIERNYKLSLGNYKKEVIYQSYCEVVDFLYYVHQRGYRNPKGTPLHVFLDTPEDLKNNLFHKVQGTNGGELLYLDREISSFVILYKDNGILIECSNYNGAKIYFTTVEAFIKKISEKILDTFVIVEPSKEDLEPSYSNADLF
jgi:hypothetical protein